MEIGLAVGGAFLSSALNVLFDRLAPHGDLLNMFQKNKHDVPLLKKLKMTLVGLQAVLSDAENKKASNQLVSQWLNELRDAVDGAENLMEQVNYESLRLKVEGQLRNLAETSNQQNEIEELIDRLLSKDASEESPAVVPIVGMGAWARQHLLKLLTMMRRITKGLLQQIGSVQVDDNLNQLQVKLKESLKGKRFLIVLDDMWNENYNEWNDLWNVFVQGGIGSKIIVTTRKESAALMMRTEQISMDTFSIDDSWSLFKRHAFENMDPMEHPELEKVGKQIVAKCKGLPLALKTLTGMLRSKSEVERWRCILRSETWDLSKNDILPALMLSYNELPPDLKPCFSYCAIFPKDYPFRKEQVIHLWIANGLVEQWGDERIQDLGNQYFNELRSRSLFERVPESSERDGGKFLMQDLVNDLAQIASSNAKDLICWNKDLYSPFISKSVLHNILPSLISLRTLSLSHYWIKELPDALFIKLKLLRFLDLSWTEIIKLPDSICALYNLATLLMSSCRYLEELPLQMEKLVNLQPLDISNTFHLKMPLHQSKLKSLQVLVGAKFLLGGLRMEDLGQLHNFGSIADNSQTERDILDELRPYSNIKGLQISGYRGTQFPNWLADPSFLKLLVQLSLSNCKDCFSLPALGQLPCLKILSIREMHRITEVTEDFYGSPSSEKPFNSLEKLEFAKMPEWKQ
ncbi:hypothetical protein CQW23_26906 [Capsicum baccatum]|uniref:NB-ARC domain-containing protein n=1 Tax=Capsicum baccatum TaxID=33114 RepID=A0A2G2VQ60_CAPBA|nr:hypothetical protein CQW23_26906 [Capsicum baccatum]